MKLKQHPDDFQVEELTDVEGGERGEFALYRMAKAGWTTTGALQAIRRRWHLESGRVAFGGLKDRHARTTQFVTIWHGPRRDLTHDAVQLMYLGLVEEPYASKHIRANRFRITLRDLGSKAVTGAEQALEEVRCDGVPNYFDDQRFGSVGAGGIFVAKLMVQERFEEALREALTGAYEHDRAEQKQHKALLRTRWGNWSACLEAARSGPARRPIEYLVAHPEDCRGALARVPAELRVLLMSAFQSHLWNKMLARWLSAKLRPEQLIDVRQRRGALPMHHDLDAEQRAEFAGLHLPLPSARVHLDATDPRKALMDTVVAEEGLSVEQLKIKGIREMFFSKGERSALSMPANLQYETQPDERHPGRRKLTFSCELARGAYATLIVKRITAVVPRVTR